MGFVEFIELIELVEFVGLDGGSDHVTITVCCNQELFCEYYRNSKLSGTGAARFVSG
jgi:hypothetical protein